MKDMFTVVTRFTAPSGHLVVHAYGPYFSRSYAKQVRDNMLTESRRDGDGTLEARTCKLLGNVTVDKLIDKLTSP